MKSHSIAQETQTSGPEMVEDPAKGDGAAQAGSKAPAASTLPGLRWLVTGIAAATFVVSAVTLALVVRLDNDNSEPAAAAGTVSVREMGGAFFGNGPNPCHARKPVHADAEAEDNYFQNVECLEDGVLQVLEQAGANVTAGYVGGLDASGREPITEPYWKMGLCPVNVHWHLGAEHLSVGEFDEDGKGPGYTYEGADYSTDNEGRRLQGATVREGFLCHWYDEADARFTTEYDWQHCIGMEVGETYEVHWPHSAAGACNTPHQYQTPFYDGVFCNDGVISLDPLNTYEKIGVQSQVFTVINDEAFYYPDLMRGMIVDGDYGQDIAKYTGSTTGTSRNNEICSRFTPITWQVDRKCHLISASSFDKLCADMKAQRDDMTDDLHAHGSRELVADELAANNLRGK